MLSNAVASSGMNGSTEMAAECKPKFFMNDLLEDMLSQSSKCIAFGPSLQIKSIKLRFETKSGPMENTCMYDLVSTLEGEISDWLYL